MLGRVERFQEMSWELWPYRKSGCNIRCAEFSKSTRFSLPLFKKRRGRLQQFGKDILKEPYFKVQAFLHNQIQSPQVKSIVWVLGESQCDVLCCCVNMDNNGIDCVVLFNSHRVWGNWTNWREKANIIMLNEPRPGLRINNENKPHNFFIFIYLFLKKF